MTVGSFSLTIEAVNEKVNVASLGALNTATTIKSGCGKGVRRFYTPGGSLIGMAGLKLKVVFHGKSNGFPCPQLFGKFAVINFTCSR